MVRKPSAAPSRLRPTGCPDFRGPMRVPRINHDEYRALVAVLHGMLYLVHEIRDRRGRPKFKLLGAMIYYIGACPERFLQPKEDECLFRLLRVRHPDAAPLLDRLDTKHRADAEKIRALQQALARYQQGGDGEFSNFLAAVEAYVAFDWDHIQPRKRKSSGREVSFGQRLGSDRRSSSESFP